MSALKMRSSGIISRKAAADYSAKLGYTVTDDGTTATVSASATVPATGVIMEGGKDANSMVQIGILGNLEGTCLMKATGIIAAGARVQQAADGSILTDAGPGNARVVIGVALEAAVAGDLIEVAPFTPMILP
jgi:hypothetical protein